MISDKHFIDWENSVFGYGYGTGEVHTLGALKRFISLCPDRGPYDFRTVENELGGAAAWLLISTLAHADIIDYGASPRQGWLSAKGVILKEYVSTKRLDQLCEIIRVDQNYVYCLPYHCNCETPCMNPLFGPVLIIAEDHPPIMPPDVAEAMRAVRELKK